VKNGAKGVKNREKAKQERKTMGQLAALIASAPIQSEDTRERLKSMGIKKADDLTNQAIIVAAVYTAAIRGDMKAVEKWQELTDAVLPGANNAEEDELSKSLKEIGEHLESDD
jgi:DNA-binding helix-hairpin-helix protein with protein kinase domain